MDIVQNALAMAAARAKRAAERDAASGVLRRAREADDRSFSLAREIMAFKRVEILVVCGHFPWLVNQSCGCCQTW